MQTQTWKFKLYGFGKNESDMEKMNLRNENGSNEYEIDETETGFFKQAGIWMFQYETRNKLI